MATPHGELDEEGNETGRSSSVPRVGDEQVTELEQWIDGVCEPVPAMQHFVLPGGTELAARRAIETGRAVNLAGGSHHADYHGGAGFCVFNDVAVAARTLIDEGLVQKIAEIDLDVHHGDGTALIFADDPSVFTSSLHCEDNWPRQKPPSDLDLGLEKGIGDAAYLAATDKIVADTLSLARPDLVFYNAGVDIHTDDRLGLLDVSDAGLTARDDLVVRACRHRAIPVVGVLGGGYSKDANAVARRHTYLVEAMQRFV